MSIPAAAKFAVEGMMGSAAALLARFGVHVSLIEPGSVNTEFVANAGSSLEKLEANKNDTYLPLLKACREKTKARFASVGQTGMTWPVSSSPSPRPKSRISAIRPRSSWPGLSRGERRIRRAILRSRWVRRCSRRASELTLRGKSPRRSSSVLLSSDEIRERAAGDELMT
jgi:hypothetical protein